MERTVLPPLLPGVPPWSEDDGAALRSFLLLPIGQRFLRSLMYSRPSVTERKESKVRRIQSDERAGHEACIADILDLAEPKPVTEQDRSAQTTQ